jgi:hypothetical protein
MITSIPWCIGQTYYLKFWSQTPSPEDSFTQRQTDRQTDWLTVGCRVTWTWCVKGRALHCWSSKRVSAHWKLTTFWHTVTLLRLHHTTSPGLHRSLECYSSIQWKHKRYQASTVLHLPQLDSHALVPSCSNRYTHKPLPNSLCSGLNLRRDAEGLVLSITLIISTPFCHNEVLFITIN